MIENPREGRQPLKIETIKGPNNSEVSYCPERGGIITSIKLQGREILYLDQITFQDPKVSVKGGIPILFPNAGPIKGPEFPSLEKHGFARNLRWRGERGQSVFMETLNADDDTKKIFPFNFMLSIGGRFNKDGSVSLNQSVQNLEQEQTLPISMGLHPYFRVPHGLKKDIKFSFEGGDLIEQGVETWSNGGVISIENPKLHDSKAVLRVVIPFLGTLIIDVSREYKRIWVWSLPGKDFVCIEPVMRDSGGLVNDPEHINPGMVLNAEINIRLKDKAKKK